MTPKEAETCAKEHNRRAGQCNSPNFLRASDFINCPTCRGSGLEVGWVTLEELRIALSEHNPAKKS